MFAGESRVFTVTCRKASDGSLVDFAAASSIAWAVYDKTGTALITKTLAGGTISQSSGVLTITLAAANTVGLSGDYRHQATTVLADGTDAVLFVGTLSIEPRLGV